MKKIFFIGALFLTGCGYDGHYRYECQDPENWQAPECNPPLCEGDGMCTETLLGFNPNEITTTTMVETGEITTP